MKNNYFKLLDGDISARTPKFIVIGCAQSQSYVGADALLTLFYQDHQVEGSVLCQTIHFRGNRRSNMYHFRLKHAQKKPVDIVILHNPFVIRLIRRLDLKIYKTRKTQEK